MTLLYEQKKFELRSFRNKEVKFDKIVIVEVHIKMPIVNQAGRLCQMKT